MVSTVHHLKMPVIQNQGCSFNTFKTCKYIKRFQRTECCRNSDILVIDQKIAYKEIHDDSEFLRTSCRGNAFCN